MVDTPLQRELDTAAAAVSHAQEVRILHRRQTERASSQRQRDIELALERLKDAMRPLRTHIGRIQRVPELFNEPDEEAIRSASQALQTERRKLWKMKDHS